MFVHLLCAGAGVAPDVQMRIVTLLSFPEANFVLYNSSEVISHSSDLSCYV